ncbi:hypothetical protein EDD37DRAFT_140412 [Exophiala viscosa]|uniref:Swi5-dependent recombination DNA repair protein 1 n=1 Tax=Exophiala viscosa TaxID=2486360 RepID=A0AAN6DQV7_9EURO|nr:hypothetical protein EDD36DRAFT_468812 [Exophiala viscosa]KAI1620982.1 hypothetical protein EDD37DRAFT_140412 [Exophiala viscosa]
MHPVKRRRLNQGTAFLNKPFRSPLRMTPSSHKEQTSSPDSKLQANTNHDFPSPRVTTSSDSIETPEKLHVSVDSAKVEYKDVQKEYTALSLHLKKLSQSLDIAQQALQIESSAQDVQLRVLISKWKAVAQDAAERLFVDVKERIDQMGGVAAWRARTQEDARHWNSQEEGNDQVQHREPHDDDAPSQNAAAIKDARESENAPADEDAEASFFTMDMMLQEMNIDLKVIGYDKDLERWVD